VMALVNNDLTVFSYPIFYLALLDNTLHDRNINNSGTVLFYPASFLPSQFFEAERRLSCQSLLWHGILVWKKRSNESRPISGRLSSVRVIRKETENLKELLENTIINQAQEETKCQ